MVKMGVVFLCSFFFSFP
uniref:Uncharacterized protein n=1 Tax=Anopheles quadriannulatus TaxID=34691 RepID=A0A182XRY6_ANOQN